jgi:hypothetical protein
MRHTHFHDDHTHVVPGRASGYAPAGDGFRLSMTTLDMVGDGGVFTTIEDLARWDANFYVPTVGGVGAMYLAAVCVLPEILISNYGVPFYFGGTSLLIVVSVTMDTTAQIQSHLIAHQYEGLIRKSRLRGARRS